MEGGEKAREQGEAGDPDAVGPMALERDITDGVNLLVELEPVVVVEQNGDGVAGDEAEETANTADDHALQDEDALDLLTAGSERHEDGDVALLFQHQHH